MLVASGNFAWLNLVTMTIAAAAVPDGFVRLLRRRHVGPVPLAAAPLWFVVAVLALAALVLVLSYWPVRNLISSRQLMNSRSTRCISSTPTGRSAA